MTVAAYLSTNVSSASPGELGDLGGESSEASTAIVVGVVSDAPVEVVSSEVEFISDVELCVDRFDSDVPIEVTSSEVVIISAVAL